MRCGIQQSNVVTIEVWVSSKPRRPTLSSPSTAHSHVAPPTRESLPPSAECTRSSTGDGDAQWTQVQRLTASVFSYEPGDEFGAALTLSTEGLDLVVGSPGFDGGKGCAYTFRKSQFTNLFQIDQQFLVEDQPQEGDRMGCSVAMEANTIIVGACAYDDFAIHRGVLPAPQRQPDSGAVFVYMREAWEDRFEFVQRLVASNVKVREEPSLQNRSAWAFAQ